MKEQGIIMYEGVDAFYESGATLKNSAGKKSEQKRKLLNAYFPTGSFKATWQAAVEGKLNRISIFKRDEMRTFHLTLLDVK